MDKKIRGSDVSAATESFSAISLWTAAVDCVKHATIHGRRPSKTVRHFDGCGRNADVSGGIGDLERNRVNPSVQTAITFGL